MHRVSPSKYLHYDFHVNLASLLISFCILLSSAPVGSSANTIAGLCTKARAAAVLCFCPPETAVGYFVKISVILTSSQPHAPFQ